MAMEVATRAPAFPARVANFYQEVVAEMRKVTWPTMEELRKATMVIIAFVAFLGFTIGVMDTILQFVLVTAIAKWF